MKDSPLSPAELVQLKLIKLAFDFMKPGDPIVTQVGLIQIYMAAMFMKRPEFMYKIFSDLHTLEDIESWLDDELDQLEALYNG